MLIIQYDNQYCVPSSAVADFDTQLSSVNVLYGSAVQSYYGSGMYGDIIRDLYLVQFSRFDSKFNQLLLKC
jgi:hypothetical protein